MRLMMAVFLGLGWQLSWWIPLMFLFPSAAARMRRPITCLIWVPRPRAGIDLGSPSPMPRSSRLLPCDVDA